MDTYNIRVFDFLITMVKYNSQAVDLLITMAINFDTWRGFGAISNTRPIWRKIRFGYLFRDQ
jgi:hypothetical protein